MCVLSKYTNKKFTQSVCVCMCECIWCVCISQKLRGMSWKATINQSVNMILIEPKISAGVFKSIQAQVCAVDWHYLHRRSSRRANYCIMLWGQPNRRPAVWYILIYPRWQVQSINWLEWAQLGCTKWLYNYPLDEEAGDSISVLYLNGRKTNGLIPVCCKQEETKKA